MYCGKNNPCIFRKYKSENILWWSIIKKTAAPRGRLNVLQYFFPHSFSLLTLFSVFFLSSCSHEQVFGRTLSPEFHIFHSHTEWNLIYQTKQPRWDHTDNPGASILKETDRSGVMVEHWWCYAPSPVTSPQLPPGGSGYILGAGWVH